MSQEQQLCWHLAIAKLRPLMVKASRLALHYPWYIPMQCIIRLLRQSIILKIKFAIFDVFIIRCLLGSTFLILKCRDRVDQCHRLVRFTPFHNIWKKPYPHDKLCFTTILFNEHFGVMDFKTIPILFHCR